VMGGSEGDQGGVSQWFNNGGAMVLWRRRGGGGKGLLTGGGAPFIDGEGESSRNAVGIGSTVVRTMRQTSGAHTVFDFPELSKPAQTWKLKMDVLFAPKIPNFCM
jgi:hypothetical protein